MLKSLRPWIPGNPHDRSVGGFRIRNGSGRGPMSRSFYQRMKERGEGPRETFLSALKIIITPQDELAWQEARADPRDAGARLAKAEAMRRERARKAGRTSLAGPNHVSKTRRRAEELDA
jgi:hypothetical protein